jgi:hypothetical protein
MNELLQAKDHEATGGPLREYEGEGESGIKNLYEGVNAISMEQTTWKTFSGLWANGMEKSSTQLHE